MTDNIVIIGNSTNNDSSKANSEEVEVGRTIINIILIILIVFMILFIYNLIRCYLPALINRNKRKMEEEAQNNTNIDTNNYYQKGNTVNLEDI